MDDRLKNKIQNRILPDLRVRPSFQSRPVRPEINGITRIKRPAAMLKHTLKLMDKNNMFENA